MPVIIAGPKQSKVKTIPLGVSPTSAAANSITRFAQFWDLMQTVQVHGYTKAAMSVIGRSTIGPGWTLKKSSVFPGGTQRQYKRLMAFYLRTVRNWNNIKDFQGFTANLLIGSEYLRYFGQAAYHILRNENGEPLGLEFLSGYVVPNVTDTGDFKSPAFTQYPTSNPAYHVDYKDPKDIVYITNPDWEGYPTGGSDIDSLSSFALPIDLYVQLTAREYMKNRDRPEALYLLPSDISEEAFNDFVKALTERYAGPQNAGRSPIAVQGDVEIKELSKLPADLPYSEARKATRDEILATTGVAGAKLGLSDSLSSANLREVRREFHETTMIPHYRLLENAFYEQVHIREFGITGWEFTIKNPDFLTAVERATVHMRYKQMGVLSANEIRAELGRPERDDPDGNRYADEATVDAATDPIPNQPGSPPEGREQNPDSPSQVGEPTLDDQDPPRGDQHDDTTDRILGELRQWRAFALKRVKKGKVLRAFDCKEIPQELASAIQDNLSKVDTPEGVRQVFAIVEETLDEEGF